MRGMFIAIALSLSAVGVAEAGSVKGYLRRDGTYVAPHYQSHSNGTVTDNYSFKGNANPYTGSMGTNRYTHDRTSPYFNGTPNRNGVYGHSKGLY